MHATEERATLKVSHTQRCHVLGILNVTPDSFSDGGEHLGVDAAVAHAHAMLRKGADLIDVGGESTRPGASRISAEVELARVVPVIKLLAADGIAVSVDTTRARVAKAAVEAGAVVINDVSGGLADPGMLPLIAESGLRCVLMHWRGHSASMEQQATYADVVAEVIAELQERVEAALAAGVQLHQVVVDPGLGFAKTSVHSWELLHSLEALRNQLGLPILIGASRKRFLTEVVGGAEATVGDRDAATAVLSGLAAVGGAWGVRVHDVESSAIAVRVGRRWTDPRLLTADEPMSR